MTLYKKISASNPLAHILDTYKLSEPNYKDWLQNIKIVLDSKKLTHVLERDPSTLPAHPSIDQRASLKKWMDEDNKARFYILSLMSDELQCQHEDIKTSRQMLAHLQEMFGEQSRAAKYQVTKRLFKAHMHDGQSVQDHCLMMIKDLEELEKLNIKLDKNL